MNSASATSDKRLSTTFSEVSTQLLAESDRGAVILAFAWVDDQLTRALRNYCMPSKKNDDKADELFGVGRPVGDASAKIDLVRRLGLLHGDTCESLHIMRRLRNDFAHLSSPLTFETDTVRSRVQNLFDAQHEMTSAIWQTTTAVERLRPLLAKHSGKTPSKALLQEIDAKSLFCIIAALLITALVVLADDVVQVKCRPSERE